MKRWKDPFPPTPEAFHNCVEQTLCGLEDTDMKHNRRYKRYTALLVAAILALLAIGAVAAVIGNNQLKRELSDAGVSDMAGRVREVAQQHGCAPSAVAAAWALQRADVALCGAKTPQQIKQNAAAAEVELSQTEISFLEQGRERN